MVPKREEILERLFGQIEDNSIKEKVITEKKKDVSAAVKNILRQTVHCRRIDPSCDRRILR